MQQLVVHQPIVTEAGTQYARGDVVKTSDEAEVRANEMLANRWVAVEVVETKSAPTSAASSWASKG